MSTLLCAEEQTMMSLTQNVAIIYRTSMFDKRTDIASENLRPALVGKNIRFQF